MKKRMLLVALLTLTVAVALNANQYYVNAVSGNNSSGNGSLGNPWKTITYALDQISGTGDTLNVAPGLYNVSLGETFPILMKNGVSIVGSDATGCIVDAAGSDTTVVRCVSATDPGSRPGVRAPRGDHPPAKCGRVSGGCRQCAAYGS